MISFLAHELFRSILFNLYIFRDFPLSLCYWFLIWFYWYSRTLWVVLILLNVLQFVLYSPLYGLYWWMFRSTWKKMYIFLLLGQVFYLCQLDPAGLICCSYLNILADFLSSCLNSHWEGSVEAPIYNCGSVYKFQLHQLFHLSRGSVFWWLYILDHYVFLINWSFYHYNNTFLYLW